MNHMKIGALIPVRLASERLPGKALKEICGRPVIHHLLDRVCACKHIDPDNAIVCTTQESTDDPLVDSVLSYGAGIFRGSTDDIIERFHAATLEYEFDAVVQVDGDDPLSATEYMDLTMDKLLANSDLDIVTCRGLPLGTAVKSFTASSMKRVYEHYRSDKNDTGFIYFFTKTDLCKQLEIDPVSVDHVFDAVRLTLDYQEDFAVFDALFTALYTPDAVVGLAEVVRFLRDNPDIVSLNADLDKEYWERTREKAQLEYTAPDGALRRIPV
jgi:spore coat polysaccharide biosynthesis protein SpsF